MEDDLKRQLDSPVVQLHSADPQRGADSCFTGTSTVTRFQKLVKSNHEIFFMT